MATRLDLGILTERYGVSAKVCSGVVWCSFQGGFRRVGVLGLHCRMALIGSTALRIDTPDSDLDVVVYTRAADEQA